MKELEQWAGEGRACMLSRFSHVRLEKVGEVIESVFKS